MSRPSTPSSRSTLVGKLFDKLRTPTSSTSSTSAANNDNPSSSSSSSSSSFMSLSTPSLLKRNASISSFHCGGGAVMGSTSFAVEPTRERLALDFEDDMEVPMPQFESDAFVNKAWTDNTTTTTATSRSTNQSTSPAYSALNQPRPSFSSSSSSSGARPSIDRDQPADHPPRSSSSLSSRHSPPPPPSLPLPLPISKASSLSRSSNASGSGSGSSGVGSVGVDSSGDGMRKSSFLTSRATSNSTTAEVGDGLRLSTRGSSSGKESMRLNTLLGEVNNVSFPDEGDDSTHNVSEISSKPSPPLSSSVRNRAPLERATSDDRILSASQPASFSHSSFATTTPALPRPGLSASTKATLERPGGRSWIERKSLMQSGAGGTELKKRRAQRVNVQEVMANRERDGLDGEDLGSETGGSSQTSPEAGASPRTRLARPPISPHGRSKSEITQSSPRFDRVGSKERASTTLNISSSTYPHNRSNDSRPASSLSHYNTSSSNDDSPPMLGVTEGALRSRSTTNNGLTASRGAPLSQAGLPQSSAMLRQRLLYGSISGNSGGESSSGPTPSPPVEAKSTSRDYRLPPVMSNRDDETARRPASPSMVPYASRRSASIDGSSPTMTREETMKALPPRAASSAAMYHDEPQNLAHPYSTNSLPSRSGASRLSNEFDLETSVPDHHAPSAPNRPASAMEMYHDENQYPLRSTGTAPTPNTNGRTILGETYRAANIAPHPVVPNGRQYPSNNVGAYPKSQAPVEYHVPLKDRSPGMGESIGSATQQQHHYVGAQYQHQQQQHQQQHQQHQMYDVQMQQMQALQQQQQQQQHQQQAMVPLKPAKKSPQCIIVNGKPYARAGILGKGGSSRVYRVLDEKNNLFAIKKVDISKNDAESRKSFINEITLLEKLRGNPQIIRLVDSEMSESKKHLLMVMEQGETDLNNLLIEHSGKRISMNFIRYIWEGMLEAVQVIHDENVVHTDLKPANFVLVKGRLKLIDFGISKAIANDTTNIGRDQQIGTANYMPPEALIDSGMGRDGKRLMKLGRAADVWSLGCILHQMVYGRTPFAHIRDVGQKIMAIQNPRYKIDFAPTTCPVDERGEEKNEMRTVLGEEVIETMRSCLKFDPKERMTIPELLSAPFLRASTAPPSAVKAPTPSISDQDMQWIVQSVTKMVTGKHLAESDVQQAASKLLSGLLSRSKAAA